ncbi:ribonuclease R [Magnetospirillum molischianum]|uniref:Ribonuclease R n=1 Tax=Magnetospirillum molischianum DSM 120 TaxID=1150626 RepID=H8FW88_MAGML|nr:ribonuclease R [Magnetospirillum molischianum]CCG42626.1 ribonuclease R [Magnetospirillum molischianum DSM 120]
MSKLPPKAPKSGKAPKARPAPRPAPVPSKQDILDFIRAQPGRVGKRELARAFRLRGDDRIDLKAILRELEGEGAVRRDQPRRFSLPGSLPETGVVEVIGTDSDGELLARPVVWEQDGRPPRIFLAPFRPGQPAVGIGDKVLCRLRRMRDDTFEGRPIKIIGEARARVLGVFEPLPDGSGRIRPTSRREKADYMVPKGESGGAVTGELVLADILPGRLYGLRQAVVKERLGPLGGPRSISLVAIHTNDIPFDFSPEALSQAAAAGPAPLAARTDLRKVPLITIDGEDARDFDDAVWAEPDSDPGNPGGWHCLVAIADVSWYVRPGDALDREAFRRGNSVYFPDRVVPMLPEDLSNGWCSLKPAEERPCLAVEFWIDRDGHKRRHRFLRGLMLSAARLTYARVQSARDGQPDDETAPLVGAVIAPLYGAWESLSRARKQRGVLELDLPERKVVMDDEGRVAAVVERERFDSHRLIEDFMIAANVCSAETLEKLGQPCMYRVHDQPSAEKLDGLREVLRGLDLKLAKGQVMKPEHFNRILAAVAGTEHSSLVNEVILRSQAQAAYSPENLGHFGLGLARYAHFTSPIRRYADLLVHRALVAGLGLGEGGLPADAVGQYEDWGQHISATERRASTAEREAVDRAVTLFLADRVGAEFAGRVSGVTRFGLFVTLDGSGADGLVPISSLPDDYYDHDEARHCLTGRRSRKSFQLGQQIDISLREANVLTGSMVFGLAGQGAGPVRPPRRPPLLPRRRGR